MALRNVFAQEKSIHQLANTADVAYLSRLNLNLVGLYPIQSQNSEAMFRQGGANE